MRIHPLAIVALLASEATAFVPTGFMAKQDKHNHRQTRTGALSMADYNLDTGFEPKAKAPKPPKPTSSSSSSSSSSPPAVNVPLSTSAKVDKIREKLQQEIAEAEAAREQVLREIEEAESRRLRLEDEATKSLADADIRRQRLATYEAQQAARAAANPLGGLAGAAAAAPIAVGTLGALFFGRSALENRRKKVEEENILEEKRRQEELAAAKSAEGKGASLLGPVLGGAVALGVAVGALNDSPGSVDSATTGSNSNSNDAIKQMTSSNTIASEPEVDLPYLENQIKQAEADAAAKQEEAKKLEEEVAVKEREHEELAAQQKAAEEKVAAAEAEARAEAEAKVAAAEEAEAKAVAAEAEAKAVAAEAEAKAAAAEAEAKAAAAEAEAKAAAAEAEAKAAAAEQEAAEQAAKAAAAEQEAAEQAAKAAAAEQEAAEQAAKAAAAEKEALVQEAKAAAAEQEAAAAAAAAEKEAADIELAQKSAAAEKKAAEESALAEQNKVIAEQAEAEAEKAEIAAAEAATAAAAASVEATTVANEAGKAEIAASEATTVANEAGKAEVAASEATTMAKEASAKAASQITIGNAPPSKAVSELPDLTNLFGDNTNMVAAGIGVVGAGVLVGVAVAASSGNDGEGGGGDSSSGSSSGGGVKPPGGTPPSSKSTGLGGISGSQSDLSSTETTSPKMWSPSAASEAPPSTGGADSTYAPVKKSFSPSGAKLTAPLFNDNSLYSPPTQATSAPGTTSSDPTPAAPVAPSSGLGGDSSYAPVKKSSFSPFGAKPQATSNDNSLYSPSTQATSAPVTTTSDPAPVAPVAPSSGLGGDSSYAPVKKSSFSPFGAKPKAASNDNSLYTPPTQATSAPVTTSNDSAPVAAKAPFSAGGDSSFAPAKKSFSPFGAKPKVSSNDNSLYSPPPQNSPPTQATSAPVTTSSDPAPVAPVAPSSGVGGDSSYAPVKKSSFSPFGAKPKAATIDNSLYAPPTQAASAPVTPSYDPAAVAPVAPSSGVGGDSSYAPVKKSSFSPFGAKPKAASNDNSLYTPPTQATSAPVTTSYDPAPVAPVAPSSGVGGDSSYAPVKKSSFSPFGAKPKAASNDNSLYTPPTQAASAPATTSYDPAPVAPVAPSSGVGGDSSYAPVKKSSFSPFGAKPKAASNDNSLYTPPTQAASAPVTTSYDPAPVASVAPSSGVGGDSSYAPVKKSSFSPFGAKPRAATNDNSLYTPPTQAASAPLTTSYDPVPVAPVAPSSGVGGDSSYAPVKKSSFSPFGAKPKAASNDNSLYAPPTQAASAPLTTSYDPAPVASVAPSSGVGGDSSYAPVKKSSFSPFGAKPKAATNDNSLYSPPTQLTNAAEATAIDPAPSAESDAPDNAGGDSGFAPVKKSSFSPFGKKY